MFSRLLLPLYKRVDSMLAKYGTSASTRKLQMSMAEYYIDHIDNLPDSKHLEDAVINLFLRNRFLRLLVQTEECLCEKYKRSLGFLDDSEWEPLFFLHLLDHVSKTYQQSQRQLIKYHLELPEGPIKSALKISRADPKWYLQPVLIKDCAEQGGCCGRSCRCCEKRQKKPGRELGVGHCTIECGCCATNRGSHPITIEEKIEDFRGIWLALNDPSDRSYYRRTMRAFITGRGAKGVDLDRDQ